MSWLTEGLGSFAIIVVAIWVMITALLIQWIAIWRHRRRGVRVLLDHASTLSALWKCGNPSSLVATRSHRLGALLLGRVESPGQIREEWLPYLLSDTQDVDACRRHLAVAAQLSSLCGLLGTTLGFKQIIAGFKAATGESLPERLGHAALAMHSTVTCLIPAIAAILLLAVLSNDKIEQHLASEIFELQRLLQGRIKRGAVPVPPAAGANP